MFGKKIRALLPWPRRQAALPGALIIGAQKCGTTALAAYLGQHPQLACSPQKELEFFGSDCRYQLGLQWYARQWPMKLPRDVIRFEASPQYLIAPQAAERIHESLPNVKLIAILRDPVHRAFSAWQMYRRQLADDPQFYRKLIAAHYTEEEGAAFVRRTDAELEDISLAIQREVECLERGQSMEWSVVELGLYGPQLQRYTSRFAPEQLLVIAGADLRFHRVNTLNRVLRFIGLAPWDWSQADLMEVFVGSWSGSMPSYARDFLREYYADSNRMLAKLMSPLPEWAHIRAAA
jgi:hypothetical protein